MRPVDGALKKKTVDEAIATLVLLPVFDRVSLYGQGAKEEPNSAKVTTPEPGKKTPPVSRMSDSERRSRYLHTENLSTPSISGMLSGRDLSGVSEPAPGLQKDSGITKERPFDLDLLVKAWREFAETVEAAQLKSALSVRDPILNENFDISYDLDNEVQRQRITLDVKPKLIAFLSRKLHNEQISVQFNVTEHTQEILDKPYTNQEKFNVLVAKYPVVGIMRQHFGLEFE